MSNIQLAITDPEYKQWISNIEKRFRQQQIKAAVQVNSSKIEFYWSLGRDICEMHVEERWGESVIKQLSEDLRLAIDEAKGLTPGNLYYLSDSIRFIINFLKKFPKLGKYLSHCMPLLKTECFRLIFSQFLGGITRSFLIATRANQ